MNLPSIYWRGRYCPLIEVNLTHNSNHVRVLAYVDTGTTYSVFQSDYCENQSLKDEKQSLSSFDTYFYQVQPISFYVSR